MEIKEIPIDFPPNQPKKVSRRVRQASEQWLQEKGLLLEDLDESQQEAVFNLFKTKRFLGWYIGFSIIISLFYAVLGYGYAKFIASDRELWVPTTYKDTNEQGEETIHQIPLPVQRIMQLHGKVSFQLGLLMGFIATTWASQILAPFFLYQDYKRNRKTIEAFLPAVLQAAANSSTSCSSSSS
jgi:hypothetical protein